jgi:hypothetical protein
MSRTARSHAAWSAVGVLVLMLAWTPAAGARARVRSVRVIVQYSLAASYSNDQSDVPAACSANGHEQATLDVPAALYGPTRLPLRSGATALGLDRHLRPGSGFGTWSFNGSASPGNNCDSAPTQLSCGGNVTGVQQGPGYVTFYVLRGRVIVTATLGNVALIADQWDGGCTGGSAFSGGGPAFYEGIEDALGPWREVTASTTLSRLAGLGRHGTISLTPRPTRPPAGWPGYVAGCNGAVDGSTIAGCNGTYTLSGAGLHLSLAR